MNTDLLQELQNWYQAQCNEDWEHQYGVTIDTLDNPGWQVKIDLKGTDLEGKPFDKIMFGMNAKSHPQSDNWLSCEMTDCQYRGFGDSQKLNEIIRTFLNLVSDVSREAI